MEEKVVKLTLPKLHPTQDIVFKDSTRFRVLKCGRQWGKTKLAVTECILRLLEGKNIAYITPTFKHAKKVWNDDLIALVPDQLKVKENISELYLELITGGKIQFFSAESPTQLRGRTLDWLCVDEAAFCDDLSNFWNTVLRPTLSIKQAGALIISTPIIGNYFEQLYQNGQNDDGNWSSYHYTCFDNPFLKEEEIEAAKNELTKQQFEQEYLAIAHSTGNSAFEFESVKRNTLNELSTKEPVVIGIDIASLKDYTVFCGLDEVGKQSLFDRFQLPYEITIDRIRKLPDDVVKVIDATGVGEPIYQRLLFEGVQNLIPFKFNSSSKPKLMFELIKAVEENKVQFNEFIASEMLGGFEFKYTASNHPQFAATTGTDDGIMALALAYSQLKAHSFYKDWELYVA